MRLNLHSTKFTVNMEIEIGHYVHLDIIFWRRKLHLHSSFSVEIYIPIFQHKQIILRVKLQIVKNRAQIWNFERG